MASMIPIGSTEASAPLPRTSSITPAQASAVAAAQRPVSGWPSNSARGDAGDRGRRAERDDGADRDARAVDRGEEGELVDGDGRGDHAQLPPRPGGGRGGDGAGDEEEERPADHDARGADAGGGGVGAERLGGARGAEADGGEEDEHLGHVLDCSTMRQECQGHGVNVGRRRRRRAIPTLSSPTRVNVGTGASPVAGARR